MTRLQITAEHSEQVLGQAAKGRRDQVVIATNNQMTEIDQILSR